MLNKGHGWITTWTAITFPFLKMSKSGGKRFERILAHVSTSTAAVACSLFMVLHTMHFC